MEPAPAAAPSLRPSLRIQKVLKHIRLRKAGVPIAEVPWQAYQFQNTEFDELQRWLRQDEELWDYVEEKVRYDYDSVRASLISRIPTVLHSWFILYIGREITKKLNEIAETGDLSTSTFAKKVESMSSSRIDLTGTEEEEGKPKMRRDPDFAFWHEDAQWPGVVLELSYPMKRRALPRLADDYILETDGNIRMLVGINLDTHSKRASISTWQPCFKRNKQGVIIELEASLVRDKEIFRDKHGNPNLDPESGLHLDLEDFGPTNLTVDLVTEVPIVIDSQTLCLCLERAEVEQLKAEARLNEIRSQRRPLRIRKRRREETESEDESSGKPAMDCGHVVSVAPVPGVESGPSRPEEMEIDKVSFEKGLAEEGSLNTGVEELPLGGATIETITTREGRMDGSA